MSNLGIWNSTFDFWAFWNRRFQTFIFGIQISTFGCQTLDFGSQSSNFGYAGLGFQTFSFGPQISLVVNPRIWEFKIQTLGKFRPLVVQTWYLDIKLRTLGIPEPLISNLQIWTSYLDLDVKPCILDLNFTLCILEPWNSNLGFLALWISNLEF
jgi:hypothetical protein